MKEQKRKWPWLFIALDVFGAVLAAVGILDLLGNGGLGAWLFLVAGLLLMLPLILNILNAIPKNGTGTDKHKGEY